MRRRSGIALLLAGSLLTACSSGIVPETQDRTSPGFQPAGSASPTPPTSSTGPDDPALGAARSTTVEDSVYPDIGDPGVDALHYDLTLGWDPDASVLTGTEELVFRAARTGPDFRLDLSEALHADSALLDGVAVRVEHDGKDLIVEAAVRTGERHTLQLTYHGTPVPVPAPTTRRDISANGFTIDADGGAWTMQEPYGAYTWYAVNDQPADKALYDFTLQVPDPMVGIANGELTSRQDEGGLTTTEWHLAEPAASYLTTVAFGDYTMTRDSSSSGVPISYWTPADRPDLIDRMRAAPAGMDWLEKRLGPFPFDTLGILVVDSESGMETQTMLTLGNTTYSTSPEVLVHEMAHQWYGDEVTPDDWRDVWMSEGMAMYLQALWQADDAGVPPEDVLSGYLTYERASRAVDGPPAAYDPTTFGQTNIYYGPALMWHELRLRIGDRKFFEITRAWPKVHEDANAGRADYLPWLARRSGVPRAFFDAWLLGAKTPRRG